MGVRSTHLPTLFFAFLNKQNPARSQAGPDESTNWVCLAIFTFARPFRVRCGHRKKGDFQPIIPLVSRSAEGTRAVNRERGKRAGPGPWQLRVPIHFSAPGPHAGFPPEGRARGQSPHTPSREPRCQHPIKVRKQPFEVAEIELPSPKGGLGGTRSPTY